MAARLRQAGRIAESLGPMQRAVGLAPANAAAQHDLGLTYLECGRIEEAIGCFRRAVALNDGFAHAHYRLGIALELQGRGEEAIAALQRAAALAPSLADAHGRLARLMVAVGRRKEAAAAYRAAAVAAPNTTEGRLNLVDALLLEERDVEAEQAVRRALVHDPRSSYGHWLMGFIQAQAGRFTAAEAAFTQSIALNPRQGIAYYNLVRSRKLGAADRPLIERMRGVAPTLRQPHQQVLLQLALGKALDDLQDYRAAMEHFAEANRIKKTINPFDRAAFARHVDGLIARFTPQLFAAHAGDASAAELPVLIIGMPRSGTTLVEQILSSHRHIGGAGERHFWNRRGAMFAPTGDSEIANFQRQAAQDCLAQLRAVAPAAARVTDKMPFNFQWAGLIHLVFPRATIVHCRRHPIDTCLSVFSTYFAPRPDFSTDRDDLVFYYRHYLRLMAHWRSVLPPDRLIEVDYEALVADPEPLVRRLIAACGLDWDPACLAPERNTRLVKSASIWQVRQPIYRGAVERWRRYEPWIGSFRALLPGAGE
jgi:tetratricopeptide (TPR) repeat protein